MEDYCDYQARDSISSFLDDLRSKITLDSANWTLTDRGQDLLICHIVSDVHVSPRIECAVTVDSSLTVQGFLNDVKLPLIKDNQMPLTLTNVSPRDTSLEDLLSDARRADSGVRDENNDGEFIPVVKLIWAYYCPSELRPINLTMPLVFV